MPLAEIEARFVEWTSAVRLDGLVLSMTITADERSFAEVDTRMAIGNQVLDGLWLGAESATNTSESNVTFRDDGSRGSPVDEDPRLGGD